jgi:biotin carboxyl carrier protein
LRLRIHVEGATYDVQVDILPENAAPASELDPEPPDALGRPPHPKDTIPDDKICRSPIAGAVVSIAVRPGDHVRQDDPIVTIEAMKMQTAIGAPLDGIVGEILVKAGDAVKPGQVLCKLV